MILNDAVARSGDAVTRLFDELYDPAFLIDPESGRFAGVNHAACAFLGYSAEELGALSPADIHPHEIPRLEGFIAQVRRHGRWVAGDLSCRARGGTLLPAQIRASLIPLEGREYILAIIRDRRDEELAELGRSIRKLTHDLRNTMVASQLMGDRLSRHEDPMVRRSAELITRSVDRALDMCQRTLETGSAVEHTPRHERFPLSDVAAEVNAAIGPEEIAGATLEAPYADAVTVDADFDQLFRLLLNLVRNALAAGATELSIRGSHPDDRGVSIDISDNGPGLPPAVREQLFNEKPGASGTGGAGLGLAIAWELARNHGGELSLAHTGPDGTTFRLVLPAAAGAEHIADAAAR